MSSAVQRPIVSGRGWRAVALGAALALLAPLLIVQSALAGGPSCALDPLKGDPLAVDAGSEDNPYLVGSPEDLEEVGAICGLGKHYLQTDDIVLPAPSGIDWNHVPIGTVNDPFTGVYDGDDHTITGLIIDTPNSDYVGLFGVVDDALLIRIRLEDVDIIGDDYVGGIVGHLKGNGSGGGILFSHVAGKVVGDDYVGGMAGRAEGLDLNSEGVAILWSSAAVEVNGGGEYVGGLVGAAGYMSILGSSATGEVTGDDYGTGGLVGSLFNGAFIGNSYATGQVNGDEHTGGLVGEADDGSIVDSYATGDVTGVDDVGGLIGYADDITIVDSYATGSVDGEANVGGLIGSNSGGGTITRSYAVGAVSGDDEDSTGGLVGDGDPDDVFDSFFDATTTGQTASAGGTGLATALMKTLATFAGADWAIVAGSSGESGDVWGICPQVNRGYPFLLWQVADAESDPCSSTTTGPSGSSAAAPSYVAPGGVLPLISPGLGEWVQADGSSVPLAVSSPGPNQVRYSADGIQVTFTGGAGSDASRGLVANPAGEIVCEICLQLAAGQVIEVWMFSMPRLVAAHLTQDLPCQTFAIPVASPLDGGGPVSAGAHTLQLALPTTSGMQAVNVGVTVGGPVPSRVPAGEGPAVPAGLLLAGLLAAAFGLRRLAVGTAG